MGRFCREHEVDVLVTFADDAEWGLLPRTQMQQDLATRLQGPIDLVSTRALEQSPNWVRRGAF